MVWGLTSVFAAVFRGSHPKKRFGRRQAMAQKDDVEGLIRRYYAAYVAKDCGAIEPLIAEVFRFTSPLDDHIDRATYFERCWPNHLRIKAFHIEKLFASGDEALVLYELEPMEGRSFRNTEFFRVRGGQIVEVQVYFGATRGTVGDSAG
jgi:ketosteroid isomerase-like protein